MMKTISFIGILAVGALVGSSADEALPLDFDDECASLDGVSQESCALNAVQLRASAKRAKASRETWNTEPSDSSSSDESSDGSADEGSQNLENALKNAIGADNYNNIDTQLKEKLGDDWLDKLKNQVKEGQRCPPHTGGMCLFSDCAASRGTVHALSCSAGMCLCKKGYCSDLDGKCVEDDGGNFRASAAQISTRVGKSSRASSSDQSWQNLAVAFENAIGDENYNNIDSQLKEKVGDEWQKKWQDEMK